MPSPKATRHVLCCKGGGKLAGKCSHCVHSAVPASYQQISISIFFCEVWGYFSLTFSSLTMQTVLRTCWASDAAACAAHRPFSRDNQRAKTENAIRSGLFVHLYHINVDCLPRSTRLLFHPSPSSLRSSRFRLTSSPPASENSTRRRLRVCRQ